MLKKLLFRNFARVYRSDRWFRHHFTPAGKLVFGLSMAAAIFGVDTRQTLAFQVFVFTMTVIILAMLFGLRFRPQFHLRRELPLFASVGEPLRYRLIAKNQGATRQRGLTVEEDLHVVFPTFEEFHHQKETDGEKSNWFDDYVGYPRWVWMLFQHRGAATTEFWLPDLPARATREARLELTPQRRGMMVFAGLTVGKPDPLGLFKTLHTVPCPDQLLVLPRRYPVPPLRLPGSRRYQQGGVSLAMSVGDSEEFLALREYRPGDPLRHIHWNSWAKCNRPVVKEFQDEFFVRHALVLDTFIQGVPSRRFEEAVSVASSLACTTMTQDTLLDLLFVGTETFVFTSGRGVGHLDQLLRVLACVKGTLDQPITALREVLGQHGQALSGAILVLIAWDEERRALLRVLRERQVPALVAVVCDEPAPDAEFPDLHWLRMGHVEADLARLGEGGVTGAIGSTHG